MENPITTDDLGVKTHIFGNTHLEEKRPSKHENPIDSTSQVRLSKLRATAGGAQRATTCTKLLQAQKI